MTAVLTLALTISANTIILSVLNALVLRPLKCPAPENLYMLQRDFGAIGSSFGLYPDCLNRRGQSRSFESLVSYDIVGGVGLDTGGGIPPSSGRIWSAAITSIPWTPSLILAGSSIVPMSVDKSVPYLVLSYAQWHSYFNSDPAAVGSTVQINKHPY